MMWRGDGSCDKLRKTRWCRGCCDVEVETGGGEGGFGRTP